MQIKHDGQNYAPVGNFAPCCEEGEFKVGGFRLKSWPYLWYVQWS